MPNDWKPSPADIERAITLLTRGLPHAQSIAGKKRQEIKDIHAIYALADALQCCFPVLPPDVAALARKYHQAIEDAYKAPSSTNKRPSEQLNPDQRNRF